MPSSEKKLVYWDACVPLSYINGYAGRLSHIEGILQDGDIQLITSVFSIVEVAFALREQQKKKLDPETEEKITKLWQVGSPILLVEFYELLAVKARNLMRAAVEKGFSLKPGDALHLATADHLKVTEFQTYDDLAKFSELTESRLKICSPIAKQPVIVSAPVPPDKKAEEKPQPEAVSEAKEEAPKAAAQAPPAVQGSGSGPTEGQAGAKAKEDEAKQKG